MSYYGKWGEDKIGELSRTVEKTATSVDVSPRKESSLQIVNLHFKFLWLAVARTEGPFEASSLDQ